MIYQIPKTECTEIEISVHVSDCHFDLFFSKFRSGKRIAEQNILFCFSLPILEFGEKKFRIGGNNLG